MQPEYPYNPALPVGHAPSVGERPTVRRLDSWNVALFTGGAAVNVYAYASLEPIEVAAIFFAALYALLLLPRFGGRPERRIFVRVFAVGFAMAGVSAVYVNHFHDADQLYLDAGSFFDMATGRAGDLGIDEIGFMHESPLAIKLWENIYNLFAAFGFAKERYVGITVNVAAVALTGVLAIKMTRLLFGEDPLRFRIMTLLVAACGLFWLFAAIHVRDSIVLLAVTGLTYSWLYYLARPDFGWRLLQMVVVTLLAGSFFGFLRAEFLFVPIAMSAAGVMALTVSQPAGQNRATIYVSVVAGFVITAALLFTFGGALQGALQHGEKDYTELAMEINSSESLGMAYIVNQPLPIRLVLGSAYLFVYPIPFWVGFQFKSAYALFKTFHVLYMYFVLPLLVLAVWQLWKNKAQRTPSSLFLLFLLVGFALAIAGTSVETRHLGAFFIPIFLLSLLPDLRERSVRAGYERLLLLTLIGVTCGHMVWAVLKMKMI